MVQVGSTSQLNMILGFEFPKFSLPGSDKMSSVNRIHSGQLFHVALTVTPDLTSKNSMHLRNLSGHGN